MKAKFKIFNEIFSWVLLIAVSFMLIFSIFTVMQSKKTGEPAFVLGYRPVLVLTGSMEPYMMTNGLALTKEVTDIEQINIGDVITYHHDTEDGRRLLITHRIISLEDGYIYTKGDNNRVADSIPLTIDNVEAKVVCVFNQTAWIAAKWQTTSGKIMLLCGAAAIVLLYISVKMWLSWLFNRKKEEDAEGEPVETDDELTDADSLIEETPDTQGETPAAETVSDNNQ